MSGKKPAYFPPPQLPCTGVESHAHLDSKRFSQDLDEVLKRARNAGVAQLGQVFLSVKAWKEGSRRFGPNPDYPEIFFLLGIHPSDAHLHDPAEVDEIEAIARANPSIRAIGEIGLDYHWKECPPPVQKDMFRRQLAIAVELDLPVVIHCRDAVEDTLAILRQEGFQNRPLLWHCFGGGADMAAQLVGFGWHLSIPGPITYPANQPLRDAVASVPLDRLMVETDCPYLTPMPLRGKRNEPAYLGYTIDIMAKARSMDPASLWTACGNTARAFFGLVGE